MGKTDARIYIAHLDRDYSVVLQKGFEWVANGTVVRPNDHIAIKPNLTFPVFRPGVMTNPEAIEALIVYLKNYTDNITICESDSGGYNRFSMDEVFRRTGISEFTKRYGVRIVNMSYLPSRFQVYCSTRPTYLSRCRCPRFTQTLV
jgi:uncharacterized protein (DUF362 family)